MKYYIAKFKKTIPMITGMKQIASFDLYTIFSIEENRIDQLPVNIEYEEITEIEGTVAWRFYGEVRGYRSAYSDVEGLEPDPDELAKGKRKTKVYHTPETEAATIQLMKRIFIRNVIDIFNERENKDDMQKIIDFISSLNAIKDITYHKERLLGIEMSKTQLKELYIWDEATNSRVGRHQFTIGF